MADLREAVRGLLRLAVVLSVSVVMLVAAWFLFVRYPDGSLTRLLGVLFVLLVGIVGVRTGANVAGSVFTTYEVGEVAVEGPITRDGGGGVPSRPGGAGADDVVEAIEQADEDDDVRALIVRLNTPGGEVVPSEDIRDAAARFDGPTVAYATDTCASGGYWIASGCDEVWAREGSIVGSIGVIGSRVNAKELADRVGLSYERLAAGEYKDAGQPLKEFDDDDREYLQGLIDDYYDNFVDRVAQGREMDPDAVRDTEARVYLGREAHELGLVDRIGPRRDLEEELADRLDVESVTVEEFEPSRPLPERLRAGAAAVAYAAGAGVASVVADDEFEFRV